MTRTSTITAVAESILRLQTHTQNRNHSVSEPSKVTIALSRQIGTRGHAVAEAIGRRLNWPVYDHEILERIADELRVSVSQVENADERPGNWLAEWMGSLSTTSSVSELVYVRRLKRLLTSIAHFGCSVIVGRGAAHFLEPVTTLRVRLVAPLNDRISVVSQDRGISRDVACDIIERTTSERARFVSENFERDLTDPSNYDLLLNASRFAPDECAVLILEALRRRFPRVEIETDS